MVFIEDTDARGVAQRFNDLLLREPYRATELAEEAVSYTARETGEPESVVQEAARKDYKDLDETQRRLFVYFYSYLADKGI